LRNERRLRRGSIVSEPNLLTESPIK